MYEAFIEVAASAGVSNTIIDRWVKLRLDPASSTRGMSPSMLRWMHQLNMLFAEFSQQSEPPASDRLSE